MFDMVWFYMGVGRGTWDDTITGYMVRGRRARVVVCHLVSQEFVKGKNKWAHFPEALRHFWLKIDQQSSCSRHPLNSAPSITDLGLSSSGWTKAGHSWTYSRRFLQVQVGPRLAS